MSSPDRNFTPTHSRSQSRYSRTSRASRSSSLARVRSGVHIDDQTGFHHEHDDHNGVSAELDGKNELGKETGAERQDSQSTESSHETEEVLTGSEHSGEKDLEKTLPAVSKRQSARSLKKDPNVVSWDGPNDPQNPKNWSSGRRWAATLTLSCFTLMSPVSSSMVAPALPIISNEFGVKNEVVSQLMLSIFVLAYAAGPLFLGPLSEMYGRVPVLQLANLFYFIFNLACGFATNSAEMLTFRFFSGLGGSAPLAIGGGLLGDCWLPEQRGRAISVYSLAPLLGPAVGPIAGGFIAENTTWRWVFWATCIADAVIQIGGIFLLQETYAPKILERKTKRLRKETGNQNLRSEFDDHDIPLHKRLSTSLQRPWRMITTQPIIQALALYMAYLYGLCYLVLSTYPTLWTESYHESVGIGGLNYISLGLGYFLGAQICAPLNDRIYRKLRDRNDGIGRPEFRVPIMLASSTLTPIGLFWYGWSAQAHTHWILPNLGQIFLSAGIIVGFQSIQTYVVDAYTRFAASGIAAVTVLRSLAGFGFPLFAPAMYRALGLGWGNSLLGFIAIVFGAPAPLLLWRYGQNLREKSPYAAGGS